MIYIDALKYSMNKLAKQDKTIFIGYNTKYTRAANTLRDVPESQLIETPVAENLMAGMAIGMSLRGYKPIVYFERFDFVLNALDSIVNHLDKIKKMSNNEYDPKVIIRVVIGRKDKPLYSCITHVQDYTEAVSKMVDFPVIKLNTSKDILHYYKKASKWETSMMLVETRGFYDNEQ
jgi:pyruvate dehydrogenase E1 component beta subunit